MLFLSERIWGNVICLSVPTSLGVLVSETPSTPIPRSSPAIRFMYKIFDSDIVLGVVWAATRHTP